jgi:3-hydroxyacyl-[acyl-carrier-protein] dehydratase
MAATGTTGRELDAVEIQRIIPHRYPFLLVDRVLELEPGQRAVGVKNVTMGDPFFQGHFPDYPVMPGVLIVEALAQVGAVALLTTAEYRGKLALFAGIDKVRFKRQVKPGDVLRLEVELAQVRRGIGTGNGTATVDGRAGLPWRVHVRGRARADRAGGRRVAGARRFAPVQRADGTNRARAGGWGRSGVAPPPGMPRAQCVRVVQWRSGHGAARSGAGIGRLRYRGKTRSMAASGRVVGILLLGAGIVIGVLLVAWLGFGVREDTLEGSGAVLGLILGFGFVVLPLVGGGVYFLIRGRAEAKELAEVQEQRRLLDIVSTRGQVPISDLVLDLKSSRDAVQNDIYELVGRGLFQRLRRLAEGRPLLGRGVTAARAADLPELRGRVELAGKGLIKCPYCGAEIFLQG